MRIDDQSRFLHQLKSLNEDASRNLSLQKQIASGSKVNQPSDDPALYQVKDDLGNRLTRLEADQRFLKNQEVRLQDYDEALGQLSGNLRQARAVALQASNAVSDATALAGLRLQMERLIENTVSVLNREVGGRYLFAGTRVESRPYQEDLTYVGDANFPGIPLPDGQVLRLNLDGPSITSAPTAELFATLRDLKDSLVGGPVDGAPHLTRLEALENHVLQRRSEAGSASRYLSQLQDNLATQEEQTQVQLVTWTGGDLAASITELLQSQTHQQANLSVIARQAKLSLVDYLR